MNAYALKLAVVTFVVAGLFSMHQLINESPRQDEPAFTSLGDVQDLVTAYKRWKAKTTGNEGEGNVVLPLGYSKGLSAEFSKARGKATLDLIGGSVSVEVSGLPEGGAFDFWLIDNLEASPASGSESGPSVLEAAPVRA